MRFTPIEEIASGSASDWKTVIAGRDGSGSRELSVAERAHVKTILRSLRAKKCEILYRGDKLQSLASRFFVDRSDPEDLNGMWCKIVNKMFFFGEKGRHFWSDKFLNSKAKRLLVDINSDSNSAILALVQFLRLCLEEKTTLEVKEFKRINPHFIQFLKADKKVFFSDLSKLSDVDRRSIRDYLVFMIHNISSYVNATPFVSSSSSVRVARRFARMGIATQDRPIVTGVFLPNRWASRVARSDGPSDVSKLLARLGVPAPKEYVYHRQREVAFFGAIFPHYILFVADLNGKRVFFNPEILSLKVSDVQRVAFNGLDVDQEDFEQRLGSDTAYALGILRKDEGDSQFLGEC